MKLKHYLVVIFLFMLFTRISAQELLCNIQVNSQQVQGTDKRVFETMSAALNEFINNRRWTNYDFKTSERIECTMVINIRERPSTDIFKASLNVVASRPVYGSSYNSVILNYIDQKFDFEYVEFQAMDYQENQFTSNLTSVLAYYVYLILGLDFDTFSPFGGTPYYAKAEEIVNTAQSSGNTGWAASEDQRNRYWLVENYLNQSYSDVRLFLYDYHFKGLDIMAEKTVQGRAAITESLNLLKNVFEVKPGLFALQLIIDAKRDEFVNIFKEANPTEKTNVLTILKGIDPANSSTYAKINQRN
jgi:hypothetical protein